MNTESKAENQNKDQSGIKWYIVHSYSGKENAVMNNLKERIALQNMEDQFGEIMVPTEEVIEMRGGQRCKSNRKFFLDMF